MVITPKDDPSSQDIPEDREDLLLRTGTTLRMMNEVSQALASSSPESREGLRQRWKMLYEKWELLMEKLAKNVDASKKQV
jgi:hypothetical protein